MKANLRVSRASRDPGSETKKRKTHKLQD